MKPYTEEKKEEYTIRILSDKTAEFELVWHRDKKDRRVEVLEGKGWKFQLDNEVPELMDGKTFFIPKETYHRVIKGTGNLKVKIYETE